MSLNAYTLILYQPFYMLVNNSSPGENSYDGKSFAISEHTLKNKVLLQEFKPQMLTALAHYPELTDTIIRFKYTSNALFPFASRPNWKTMYRSKKKWEYLIIISESCRKMESILLKNIPYEGQVGVIGHELAHTSNYLEKNFWQMVAFGICYFLPGYRKQIENDTDKSTIAHGLGWQLFEFSNFVRNQQKYRDPGHWFNKYYLPTSEIIRLTKENR